MSLRSDSGFFAQPNNIINKMAEVRLIKTSEKVIIWLHREDKTQLWLAEQLGQTRQSISQKIKENYFTPSDLIKMKFLGFNLD